MYRLGAWYIDSLAFSGMCPRELPIKLVARVIHDRRRRPVCRYGITRRGTRDVSVLVHGRADDVISGWNRQTWGHMSCENKKGTKHGVARERPDDGNSPVLSTDLACRSCLRTYFFSEGVHFLDNQLLHALDRVFLFKRKVEFLVHVGSNGRMQVGRDKKIRHAQARNRKRTASQMGSSAGSCHTWRYGWFNACSQLIRLAGSKHNIWERRSIARGLAWGYRVANGTRGLIGSDRM